MVRLIPFADWQLGARFAQYGSAAERRCAIRRITLGDTLTRAVKREADAFFTIAITPEHKTTLREDGASTPQHKTPIAGRKARRQQPRSLDFRLPVWVRSGAREVQTASTGFARLDAHVVVSHAEVLPEFEKLPERNRRAAAVPQQFLICLRLAVAQELSADEPQVLILDDVLVNTDPVRQERILDALGTQAARLQILNLTCHADRYRGVAICSDIRVLKERIVEFVLLADVVQRHRRAVNTQGKIHQLAKIRTSDCDLIDEMMTKYSCFEHSQPTETPVELPQPDELAADLDRLLSWHSEFKARAIT